MKFSIHFFIFTLILRMQNQNRIFRKKYHFLENSFSKFRSMTISGSQVASPISSRSESGMTLSSGIEKRNFFQENQKYDYDIHYKNFNLKILNEEAFFSKSTPDSMKNSSLPSYIQLNLLNFPEKTSNQKFLPYPEKSPKSFGIVQQLNAFFPQKKVFLNSWILPFLGFVGFTSVNPRLDSYLNLNVHKILFPLTQKVLPRSNFLPESNSLLWNPKSQTDIPFFVEDKNNPSLEFFQEKIKKKSFPFVLARTVLSQQQLNTNRFKENQKNFYLQMYFPTVENSTLAEHPIFGFGPVLLVPYGSEAKKQKSKEIFSRFHLNRSFYNFLRLRGEEKIPKKLQKNQILLNKKVPFSSSSKKKKDVFQMFQNETNPLNSYNLAKTWVDEIFQKDLLSFPSSEGYVTLSESKKEQLSPGIQEPTYPTFVFTEEKKWENRKSSLVSRSEELDFSRLNQDFSFFEKKQKEDLEILEKSNLLKILNTELKNHSSFQGKPKIKVGPNFQVSKSFQSSLKKEKFLVTESPQEKMEFLKKEISLSLRKLYLKKALFEQIEKQNVSKERHLQLSSTGFKQKGTKEFISKLSNNFRQPPFHKNPFLENQKIFHYMKTLQKIENQEKFQFLSRFSTSVKNQQNFKTPEKSSIDSFLVFENQKQNKNEELQRFHQLKWMAYRLLVLRYLKTSIHEKLMDRNFSNISSSFSKNKEVSTKHKTYIPVIQQEQANENEKKQKEQQKPNSEHLLRLKIFKLHTPLLMQETLFSNTLQSSYWDPQKQDPSNNEFVQEKTFLKNENILRTSLLTDSLGSEKNLKVNTFEPFLFSSSQNIQISMPFSNLFTKIYNTMCLFLESNQSYLLNNHDILTAPFLESSTVGVKSEFRFPEGTSLVSQEKGLQSEYKKNQKNLEKIFRAYLSCKSNQTRLNSPFFEKTNNPQNALNENSLKLLKKWQFQDQKTTNSVSIPLSENQNLSGFFDQKIKDNLRIENKKAMKEKLKEENLLDTSTKTLSPNKLLKRFGFLFFNKNEMESTNSLLKQKYQQKKRRRKKLKLENRRRKKRKRFYPRPVWLRLNLYKSFYTKRFLKPNHENLTSFNAFKNQPSNFLFETKSKNIGNKYSLAVFNHHSQYQISNTVMSDFQRLCWKSYWLRSNLTPYIQRVQTKLQKMREVQSATEKNSFLQNTLSEFLGFRVFLSEKQTSPFLNSQDFSSNFNQNSKKDIQKNVEFSTNLRNIAEYDRILYDRISEILQNVKTNLNGNGQNHARSFKRGHLSKTLTTNSPLQNTSQRDPDFQAKKKKKGMLEKMESFLNPEMDGLSFFDQKTKPYGDLPTLRALWALNQTNVLSSPGGAKFSKTKHLWATLKIREQNKANKTKKFLMKLQNSAKIQAFNRSSFSNSNLSLSSKVPYAFHSLQEGKLVYLGEKETKEIENKSLYFAKTKLETIEKKLQYLGLPIPPVSSVSNPLSCAFAQAKANEISPTLASYSSLKINNFQKNEKNEIYHLENSNYKNILRQLKFQLKSKNNPSSFPQSTLGNFEKEEPRKQFSSRIQFWWLTNKSNPNLFLTLKNSNDSLIYPLSGTKNNGTSLSLQLGLVESCSILFHIFCLFCFLRISEIRSFLKFFVLVFYKLSNSYLAITYSLYNLLRKYQKQTEETFVVIRQNTLSIPKSLESPFNQGTAFISGTFAETKVEQKNGRASYVFLFSNQNSMHPKKLFHSEKSFSGSFPFKNQNQNERFLNFDVPEKNQNPSTFLEFSFYVPSLPKMETDEKKEILKKTRETSSWPFILGEKSESIFLLKSSLFVNSAMQVGFGNQKNMSFKDTEQNSVLKSNTSVASLAMKTYTYLILTSLNLRKISVQSFSKIVLIFYFGLKILLDIIESFMLIIYKFFEKPAEFMVEWIAELFLVEWSSDVRTFVPESFDIYTWSSFKKMTRGSFALGPAGFFIQRRLWYFMEIFMNLCKKPDADLNARQKKGILFWDIWAEILTDAAKKYQVNLQSLTTNSTEQDSFLEKLFNDPFLFDTPYSSSFQKNSKTNTKLKSLFPSNFKDFPAGMKNTTENKFFPQNPSNRFQANEYRWSANQYFTGRELDTDLFVDIHPPKSFNHISTTISLSGYQSLGQIVQQIYSGIFEKQVAKNLLIVGEKGSGKSLLVQALAGETSIRLITDNAHRYAINIKGVAVGMKLLRDVFDALALQTPCLFLMEDIHKIGERRPMLISDDENASLFEKKNSLRLTTGNEEVHEKNQLIYQLSKHSISNYKRPYKGDFSFLIPTNHFCFDLFLGKSPPKTRKNLTSPKNALFENLRNSTLNAEIENESLKTSFGNQKEIFMSHLMIPSTTGFAPPATSPFTILGMKEQQKFKVRKLVQEMPWGGFSTDQLMLVKLSSYSIRVKVALLADMAMNKLLTKLDMITDLLVIMDNVRMNKGFVVFATTHVPFVLDPALRRPGRFDETIKVVSKSNFLNRYEILKSNLSHYSSTVDFLDYSLLLENSIGSLQANAGELNSKDFIQKTKLLLMSNYSLSNLNQNKESKSKILQTNFNNTSLNQAIKLSSLSLFIDSESDSINVNNQMFKFFYPYKRKESFSTSNIEGLNLATSKNYVFSNFSVLSLAYSRISRFLIQSQFLKDNRAFRFMLSIPYGEKLENQTSSGSEEFLFRDFYSKNYEIQNQLMFLFSGKAGEFFVLNNFQNASSSFSVGNSQNQHFPSSLAQNQVHSIEMDAFWRSAVTFVFSVIQKRFLYQKNMMATRLFDFADKEMNMEPPSPPISKILMPTKKYENFKRVEKDFQQKPLLNIQQKIQFHQQQRFMKSLYQKQISSYSKKNPSISEITKELAYIENSLNKPSSVNCYYKARILNRHRFSRLNHWWNGQLAEHNVETSRLSDVDWRSMFSESFGDLTIDYPDAEQYYNPKYRRWFLQSSYGGYWLSFQKTILFEIYQHFMILCYNKVSNYLETEREILDYFASMYLQKSVFQEIDFIATLSRFSSNPVSTKEP